MVDKLLLFLPEAYLLGMALVMFFFSLSDRQSPARAHALTLTLAAGLVAVAVFSMGREGMLFFDAYRVDLFSQLFKVVLALSLLLVVIVCGELRALDTRYHPEFYFFLCTCTLGMMMLVSGMELMTIYLSLEISSFSLYILVPLRKGSDLDVETGIKYLFIGVAASCLMLFGMGYIFGMAGTTYVPELMAKLPQWLAPGPGLPLLVPGVRPHLVRGQALREALILPRPGTWCRWRRASRARSRHSWQHLPCPAPPLMPNPPPSQATPLGVDLSAGQASPIPWRPPITLEADCGSAKKGVQPCI